MARNITFASFGKITTKYIQCRWKCTGCSNWTYGTKWLYLERFRWCSLIVYFHNSGDDNREINVFETIIVSFRLKYVYFSWVFYQLILWCFGDYFHRDIELNVTIVFWGKCKQNACRCYTSTIREYLAFFVREYSFFPVSQRMSPFICFFRHVFKSGYYHFWPMLVISMH